MRLTNIPALFVLAYLVDIGYCAILGNLFKPCSQSDPNLRSCLINAAQEVIRKLQSPNGFPEYKIVSFNPLVLGDFKEQINNLNFSLLNTLSIGLPDSKVQDVKIDFSKKTIVLKTINNGSMDSDYMAEGQLLTFPISGNGKAYVTLTNIAYTYKMQYDIVKGKDGKDHWKIIKHSVTYSPDNVKYEFTNLFNGHSQLGETLNAFANENWREIFVELGTPTMTRITNTVVKNINRIFSHVAIEDIILP